MRVSDYIAQLDPLDTQLICDVEVKHLTQDSREVNHQTVFVAIRGTRFDGHQFIHSMVESRPALMVYESEMDIPPSVNAVRVSNTKQALATLADFHFGSPSKQLQVVGITGTNGKSSTVLMLHQLAKLLGIKSGLISTLFMYDGEQSLPTINTTPDSVTIQSLFAKMLANGCSHVFMEVSSHGIDQYRTHWIDFNVAGFSNLSQDHLDYHGSMAAYRDCKKTWFDQLSDRATAVINLDDKHASYMVQNTEARVITTAVRQPIADHKAKILENTFEGLSLEIDRQSIWTRLSGEYNVYNLLMTYTLALVSHMGSKDEVLVAMSQLTPVRGRMEYVPNSRGIHLIIDYAHTPDALDALLKTIREQMTGSAKLITLFGCGGDRDKAKRPMMARAVDKWAHTTIVTSDNPRTEDPQQIISEVVAGFEKQQPFQITDRREAIRLGVQLAQPADVLVIAGKGHETYQDIKGQRLDFDDRQVALELLNHHI